MIRLLGMDPFADVIRLLRPEATLWHRIEADGRWAVSFRKRDDVLFCSVRCGDCRLLRPARKPLLLRSGDFVMIRTSSSFRLASDSHTKPVDSEEAFAQKGITTLRVGSGSGHPVTLDGGRFVFNTCNEQLLTGLLPALIHVPANGSDSESRIKQLLHMNAQESAKPRAGSDLFITRVMELLLIELLREYTPEGEQSRTGLLAGLADTVISPALRAIHENPKASWTVAKLARLVGVSRSTFATRFQRSVGHGPIQYLMNWRMALAKDALRAGKRSLSEIAFAIGFQSVSAFSTAFRKRFGLAPSSFTAACRAQPKGSGSFTASGLMNLTPVRR